MRNQMLRPVAARRESPAGRDALWETDANPGRRLAWLVAILCLPLLATALRLGHLQYRVGLDRFVSDAPRPLVTFEPIPSRDGRILSADGRVLAADVERFEVKVHYRWIEDPPNARWLRERISAALPRAARRDRARREAAEQEIRAARDRFWEKLSAATGVPQDELARRRAAIQARVERIAEGVQERRDAREARRASPDSSETRTGRPWWEVAWRTTVETLTTAPERPSDGPVVVQEELDHHALLDGIELAAAAAIESDTDLAAAARIEVRSHRAYPQGSLAAHTIGSRTRLAEDEATARSKSFPQGDPLDYRPGDRIGRSGVEAAYDRHLHGLPGLRRVERDRHGIVLRTEVVRPPRIGRDLVLTLEGDLQTRCEKLLDDTLAEIARTEEQSRTDAASRERSIEESNATSSERTDDETEPRPASPPRGACLVVLDVRTGAVLVAANAPRFDLAQVAAPDPATWDSLRSDPRRPFFPRATAALLPPGSTFKPVTALAVLSDGRIDPDATLGCRGYLDHPGKHRCYVYQHFGVGHGDLDLAHALCQSCNVYFFDAARRTGPDPLVSWARRLGFGAPTGIDVPGEAAGRVPAPGSVGPDGKRRAWQTGATLGLAIGQDELVVTPLQVARLMAAISNGGELVVPHVVRGTGPTAGLDDRPEDAGSWPGTRSPQRIPDLSPGHLARIREGLRMTVEHPTGTGYKTVRHPHVPIAGKTGTAETGGGRPDHAWFAGYVPADRPRYAFAIVVEHGGSGGKVAGPVARKFVEALLDAGLLEPVQLTRAD